MVVCPVFLSFINGCVGVTKNISTDLFAIVMIVSAAYIVVWIWLKRCYEIGVTSNIGMHRVYCRLKLWVLDLPLGYEGIFVIFF